MRPSAYDRAGRRKYLNKKENVRFRKAVDSLPLSHQAFCLTIYFTGCRISEALSLTADDIDWESSVVRFLTLKRRSHTIVRRIPIPKKLLNQLREIAGEERERRLWQFSRTTGWRIVKNAMREANIEGAQAMPKGLRHGFGVRSAIEAIPINLLSGWMGHADITTTTIYMNVTDDEELEFIKRTWS